MNRHSWKKDDPKKGYSTCRNCDLLVKTYKIKKGGLPRCNPEEALKKSKITCNNHEAAAIAGARLCWNCGQMYTKAEMEAGRIKMEKILELKGLYQTENPLGIPL